MLLNQLWNTMTGRHDILSRCQNVKAVCLLDQRNKSVVPSSPLTSLLIYSEVTVCYRKLYSEPEMLKALFGTEWTLKRWHKMAPCKDTNLCNEQCLQPRLEVWGDAAVAEASSAPDFRGILGILWEGCPGIRASFSRGTDAEVLVPSRGLSCPWAQHCALSVHLLWEPV